MKCWGMIKKLEKYWTLGQNAYFCESNFSCTSYIQEISSDRCRRQEMCLSNFTTLANITTCLCMSTVFPTKNYFIWTFSTTTIFFNLRYMWKFWIHCRSIKVKKFILLDRICTSYITENQTLCRNVEGSSWNLLSVLSDQNDVHGLHN